MTQAARFDEQTHWDQDPGGLRAGGAGWAPPGADVFIDRADPYWGRVLGEARRAYGDANMHFNTDSVGQERLLVFGDGTPVPRDGSLAYRDAANNTTYLLNTDGTVSLLGPNGVAGPPITPSGFRRTPEDRYAPIDSAGHQVAPLTTQLPPTPNGYQDRGGVLTPKTDPDPSAPAPPASPLPTDEQQSGRAADAVKKLHEELAHRYSQISDAEGKLSEVLLSAHATTADGQQKLQAIQQKIIVAINNPDLSLDTPAGEQAFLTFLRGQVAAIGDVVTSGTLSDDDQAKALEALANLYGTDPGSLPAPAADPATVAPTPTAGEEGLNLGPEEPMPDPTLSDLGLSGVGAPPAPDPLASLVSALPAALGAVPSAGLGGFGADPFSSLTGAVAPLAGLASQLGDQPRRDDTADDSTDDKQPDRQGDREAEHQPPQGDSAAAPPASPEPVGTPGDGAPPAAPAASPAPAPTTTVSLPDGSTATARTAALAAAVKSYLGGTPVDAAYRDAGIELPPPGTPVTNPVDPSALSCGAIGMFKDHYVVALSPVKAVADGQVVLLSAVASGPDFLGWMDPAVTPAAAPVS